MVSLAVAFWLFVYKYVLYNYREVAQSQLVCETICGRDRIAADLQPELRRYLRIKDPAAEPTGPREVSPVV